MTYRSDFNGMMENIDLVVKLLWDVKDRIDDREALIVARRLLLEAYNKSKAIKEVTI